MQGAMMAWKVVLVFLAALIGLDVILPSSDSGPENAARLLFGLWLAAFLILTLIAWAARGRWRALILFAIASPIWLWSAYILAAFFIWPDAGKNRVMSAVGLEAFLAITASAITAIGVLFWRRRFARSANLPKPA